VTNFVVRTWDDIEYQVNPSSAFYEYAQSSPPEDKMALAAYRNGISGLPIAVPVYENSGFWNFMKNWMIPWKSPFRKVANYIPGGLGTAAQGFNAIADRM
jgi:hypothetical protein